VTFVKAKKRFGQNFMVNTATQLRVVAKMESIVRQNENLSIVEIGPGQGDLTQYFLGWGREVVALEIDPEAIEYLKTRFLNQGNFGLYEVDALDLFSNQKELEKLLPQRFVLLASLPYNVGSRILMDIPIYLENIPVALVLQKEVVQKISKKQNFTLFGSWLSLFWDFKKELDLFPQDFSPQPNVISSLVTGKNKDLEEYLSTPEKRIKARNVLKKLFSNPSKTLANNLLYLDWSKTEIDSFFEKHAFSKNLRLGWENYEDLLKLVL